MPQPPVSPSTAPVECSLCVEHFPDKSPSPMEINRIAFACGRQYSLDDHIDNWPLYGAAPDMFEALQALSAGFADGSIRFTKKRQGDNDPYHPANVLMCAAIAKAEGR